MRRALAALLLLSAASTAHASSAPRTVLLVSIDALHPAAVTAEVMPELRRLMARGEYTLQGRSTNPPKTLVAHTAMFTGLPPDRNGKTDNAWSEGEPTVRVPTLFDVAKRAGYRTAFFYGKEKLGYLAGAAVDAHALAPDDGIDRVRRFLTSHAPALVALHVSGLEFVGMESGWLSPEYLAKARSIDAQLAPLFNEIERRGNYLIVITSDHAGHGLEHGTDHPEDGRRPLVLRSDRSGVRATRGLPPEITEVMSVIAAAVGTGRR